MHETLPSKLLNILCSYKKLYIVHFSHVLQDEADNFSSGCVDVFVPHKGHVVGERLDVPEKTHK